MDTERHSPARLAWLGTSAKLYHGDRSVYEIKAQLGARSEFCDPFLTP